MRAVHVIYVGTIAVSVVVHVALGAGLKRLPERKHEAKAKVAVITNQKKKQQNKEDEKPPKPVEPPKPILTPRVAAPKAAAAPPPEAAPPPTTAPASDAPRVTAPAGPGGHFGLEGLSFGNGGGTMALGGGGGG